MANGVKTYQIQINGITESVKAVESLNKELNELEARIKALEGKSVGVKASSTSTGGGSSSPKSSLDEEEKLAKQIEQIDAKRVAYSKEIYQNYLAAKDVLKETVNDQKSIAASERLQANSYSNTIQGMKQELADIKSAMQTVDLGDTDKMDAMAKRANELNEALKKIEESYGQFGKNVGNYASAADGFEKLKINVAGVTQEFDTAKQAFKTLSNELKTLQVKKDQGMLLSEEELKRFNELPGIVAQLRSSIQDAGKPMDALMDTMQSIVAIAQTGKGLAAFFGIDDDAIERSIQKLVGLQNIMQGIQTLSKQLQERQGIGAWLSKASSAIDSFANGLVKSDKAAKGLSLTLKALTGIAVVAVIMAAVQALSELSKKQKEVNKATEEGTKEYAKTSIELKALQKRLDDFTGTQKQEERLVNELNSKYGEALGQYKSLAQWKTALATKGAALCKVMQKEAEMQAWLNLYTENYIKLQKAKKLQDEGGNQDTIEEIVKWVEGNSTLKRVVASIKDDFFAPVTDDFHAFNDEIDREVKELEKNGDDILKEVEKLRGEIDEINKDNKLYDFSDQIDKNGKKTKKAVSDIEKEINNLELKLMKDGLGKKLRQIDEEERQTINKLREGGRKNAAEIEKVQRLYAEKRRQEIAEYLKNIEVELKEHSKNIKNMEFDINISKLKNSVDEIENEISKLSKDQPIKNTILSSTDFKNLKSSYNIDEKKLSFAKVYKQLFDESEVEDDGTKFYMFLTNYIKDKDENLYRDITVYQKALADATSEKQKKTYEEVLMRTFDKVDSIIKEEYANELLYVSDYMYEQEETLSGSLEFRLKSEEEYSKSVRDVIIGRIQEQAQLNEKLIKEEVSATTEVENQRYKAQKEGLDKIRDENSAAMLEIQKQTKISGIEEVETIKDTNKKLYEQYKDAYKKYTETKDLIEKAAKQHQDKLEEISKEGANKIKENEINSAEEIAKTQEKLFDNQIQNIRDAQTKINEILNSGPVMNKQLGIVDLSATKKQYKELVDATKKMVNQIVMQKAKLNAMFALGLITPEAMNATKQQLNDLEQAFKNLLNDIEREANETMPKFIQSCQIYVQGALDSFQTIMNEVWNAQDTTFDKEQEQLDKANEELENKLKEQEDLISKHKSSIDEIEDELATARGDRRQHLIDQINAEMAAERAAQKEKQKIEKEQEKQQEKQKALDKKRKKEQYHRDVLQAIVSGALAVVNGLATVPFLPTGVAMAALAAATTAVQLGIMAANKPYAKGGVLEGPSHKQGGIPVGNTGIEVEGKEYVIRKKSTTPNVELLDMINRSERKLNLDDFIDFYTSGRAKKSISSMSPRTRFAEGGTIPTITNDYAFDDRLLTAFEDYSNRPVYVSVVDINNRQDAVKNVQVLAGIE